MCSLQNKKLTRKQIYQHKESWRSSFERNRPFLQKCRAWCTEGSQGDLFERNNLCYFEEVKSNEEAETNEAKKEAKKRIQKKSPRKRIKKRINVGTSGTYMNIQGVVG